MRIQINSDKNIGVDTRVTHFVEGEANRVLKRFAGKLTRVEFHLSDVNAHKFGTHDKRCLVEARPAGHRPLTVSNAAATVPAAVGGVLIKLRSALQALFGRTGNGAARMRRPQSGKLARWPSQSGPRGTRRSPPQGPPPPRKRATAKRPWAASVAPRRRGFTGHGEKRGRADEMCQSAHGSDRGSID